MADRVCTPARAAEIWLEVQAKQAADDALFDEYLALGRRGIECRITNMSGGEEFIGEKVDIEDFERWCKLRG